MSNTLPDITELPIEIADNAAWHPITGADWTGAAREIFILDHHVAFDVSIDDTGVVVVTGPDGVTHVHHVARAMHTPLGDAHVAAEMVVAALLTAEVPDHPAVLARAV